MKKILNWTIAAALVCGASVFTACSSDDDSPSTQEQIKKNRNEFIEHTRAALKSLAENLNFSSWERANMINLYFNEYVLNNPEFNKTISEAFLQKALESIQPVEEGSTLAAMGFTKQGVIDLTEFNYRFTMKADNTGFNMEEADDFEMIVNAFNPTTSQMEEGVLKLTLQAGGNKSFKVIIPGRTTEGLAFVAVVPSEFRFALADKFTGTWVDGITGAFNNEVTMKEGAEFFNANSDGWTVSGTVASNIQANPATGTKADVTTINFFVSDNPVTKEIKREFNFMQNGRHMLSLTVNGRDELGILPFEPGTDKSAPEQGEGLGPEKPDLDGDGQPDEQPETRNSDSKLMSLLINLLAGKSFDQLSLTLLDDLTTTMSIGDCSRALQLAQEGAKLRRSYADQAAIDQITQQLNELITAQITCKGLGQIIPMRLVTAKFGVDYWTLPAFNFADSKGQLHEDGYVSLVDLLDTEATQYGINIIDHAANPMQQSIIVVRQLLQYFQNLYINYQVHMAAPRR